jgi:hypothetical protein
MFVLWESQTSDVLGSVSFLGSLIPPQPRKPKNNRFSYVYRRHGTEQALQAGYRMAQGKWWESVSRETCGMWTQEIIPGKENRGMKWRYCEKKN